MGNISKKISQRTRELNNEKKHQHTNASDSKNGQSGAQAGNPGMKQKRGAVGGAAQDAEPTPDGNENDGTDRNDKSG